MKTMKPKETTQTDRKLKLRLNRETLRALEPPDLERILAGATSACRSGVTCCRPNCTGGC